MNVSDVDFHTDLGVRSDATPCPVCAEVSVLAKLNALFNPVLVAAQKTNVLVYPEAFADVLDQIEILVALIDRLQLGGRTINQKAGIWRVFSPVSVCSPFLDHVVVVRIHDDRLAPGAARRGREELSRALAHALN